MNRGRNPYDSLRPYSALTLWRWYRFGPFSSGRIASHDVKPKHCENYGCFNLCSQYVMPLYRQHHLSLTQHKYTRPTVPAKTGPPHDLLFDCRHIYACLPDLIKWHNIRSSHANCHLEHGYSRQCFHIVLD